MSLKLPFSIDPIKSAQRRLMLSGFYLTKDLKRLQDLVVDIKKIECDLSFEYDEQKLCVISLKAEIDLVLTCQRCRNELDKKLVIKNKFVGIKSTFNRDIPDYYDPVYIDEFGEIDIISLFEDEVILSLPAFPMHENDDAAKELFVFGDIETDISEIKENPFSVLNDYKFKS